jgi:hypothetical protein
MGVFIKKMDGKRVSKGWWYLLDAARRDGLDFRLNSGYRSVAEQWKLYRAYKAGRGPLAAYPGTSTHNKLGWRQGVDIGPNSHEVDRLIAWADRRGVTLKRTVPGEWWHLNARSNFVARIKKYRKARLSWWKKNGRM